MTINPRDYDLRELRRMAKPGGDVSTDPEGSGSDADTPDEVLRFNRRRELLMLESNAADGECEKPYLDRLPNTYGAEVVVFEWLDFLINKSGFKATGNALDYYVKIGWLTESVVADLRTYMRGFAEVESYDPDAAGPQEPSMDDHALSLVYIARLAAID